MERVRLQDPSTGAFWCLYVLVFAFSLKTPKVVHRCTTCFSLSLTSSMAHAQGDQSPLGAIGHLRKGSAWLWSL